MHAMHHPTFVISRPQKFRFVNSKYTNKWGMPRGYAIVHGATTSQLLPPSHPLTRGARCMLCALCLLGHAELPGETIFTLLSHI